MSSFNKISLIFLRSFIMIDFQILWIYFVIFRCHFIMVLINDFYKFALIVFKYTPDSKVHGANLGPIWGWQNPGGPHVGPVNIAILDSLYHSAYSDEILHCIRVYPYSPKATMVLCHIRETKMVQKINRSLWTQISIHGYFCLNRVTLNYDQCPCYGHWLRKMGSCT